ncbi:hypothetical protein [Pseudomonas sp. S31]|uniref:hypothetical protein n=1 Tax=Pseudomonas sp. S31 TaxID=1564473 RepID=UPI0019149F59|nr:hypothetical protein [Pseudomonas sp. S31]
MILLVTGLLCWQGIVTSAHFPASMYETSLRMPVDLDIQAVLEAMCCVGFIEGVSRKVA